MPASTSRFLVIRLSSIGDIVHALPAVAALAEAYPHAEIDWVVEARLMELLAGNPHTHRLIKLDTLQWRKELTARNTLDAIARGIRELREVEYDAAVDFQGLYKSAFIARVSRSRVRVGFAEAWLREPAAAVFYTDRVAPPEGQHVIEMNLALVNRLGARRPARECWQFPLPCTESDVQYVEEQLAALGSDDFIVINPGGGWKSKCWAPENYAGLIRILAGDIRSDFFLTGSRADEPVIREIINKSGSSRAKYFPSTITQFILVVRRAQLFVGGDTGPMHLAAAVRTPIVALYGPTDPARNGPFCQADITLWNQGPIDYTRRAAQAGYLPGIAVESVRTAIHERLARVHG
ncbi:MAG: glycosyltransferase family 9 protein [Terriglobia bacterium]